MYKQVTNQHKLHIRSFRENLAAGLLDPKDENQNARVKSTQEKHHLASRLDSKDQKLHRKCIGCYAKLKELHGRRVARNRAKTVYTFCEKYPGGPQLRP